MAQDIPGAAPGAADPAAPPDLQGKLDGLKSASRKNQDQIDTISKDNNLVLQNIASLEAGINDVNQIVKAYTQSSSLKTDWSSLQSFVDQQMKVALAEVGDGKTALDQIVAGVDGDIQNQAKITAEFQTTNDQAVTAQTNAGNVVNTKQAAYDKAKTTLSRAQAAVTDLKSLKAQAISAASASDFGAVYLLLGEMKAVLSSGVIPTPADLETQLKKALADLHATLSDSRIQQQKTAAAAADLTDAQKKLNEAQSGRRASLLTAAKKWKAPVPEPAAPAPPPGPAPQPPAPAA